MSEKINLRMLDPIPAAPGAVPPPHAVSAEASFAPEDDADISQKLDQEQRRERAQENHIGGWIGGALGAALSAIIIAVIAATCHVWIKWLSIGIGFVVALGVRKLGHGTNKQFGVIGATWAFIGCVLSYHLACIIVLAGEQGVPVLEFIQGVESWSNFIIDVLGPKDFAIYVAAMAAGYKFSYSNLADEY